MLSVITILVMSIAVLLLFDRYALNSRLIRRHSHEKRIDTTESIIVEIRKIKQLVCACYYEDMLVKEHDNSVVVIVKGVVSAGIDFSNVSTDDLKISDNELSMSIPHAKIFDVTVNPSDIDVFSGNFPHEDYQRIVREAKERLQANSMDDSNSILKRADDIASRNIQAWFKVFGFSDVKLVFKDREQQL